MSILLGIDGGGTGTSALCLDTSGQRLGSLSLGPSNVRLANDRQLLRLFQQVRAQLPQPDAICAGFAGLRAKADHARLSKLVSRVWPKADFRLTHDLEIALAAAHSEARKRVLILSGTGSCCYGQSADRVEAKAGGWGHLLGDRGSGYDLSLRFLRELLHQFDLTGNWPREGADVLRHLALNSPEDLIGWMQSAEKAEVAELAPLVFKAPWARAIVRAAAADLADQANRCAQLLSTHPTSSSRPLAPSEGERDRVRGFFGEAGSLPNDRTFPKSQLGEGTAFVFAGSVFLHQPTYVKSVTNLLRQRHPNAAFEALKDSPALGACKIAAQLLNASVTPMAQTTAPDLSQTYSPVASSKPSPTELRNPRSMNFSDLGIREAAALMLSEEAKAMRALEESLDQIEAAVQIIVRAFKKKGRLFYVGAGTSGRLGALDASECPPTFRSDPEQVQAIMAGGQRAFWRAVEGAEDSLTGGRDAIIYRGVGKADVVVGIAASGRTPFVWGALQEAKSRGAATILITLNPWLEIPRAIKPNVVIAPDTGPEVLTGSTRLKSGTATKLLLNIFTTVAMAQMGKVMGNLMIDLNPSNLKLRDRAIRIVAELASASPEAARAALEANGWIVKRAVEKLRRGKAKPASGPRNRG